MLQSWVFEINPKGYNTYVLTAQKVPKVDLTEKAIWRATIASM
ncbi:MAG: hypothetical protein O2842_06265 [Bacteroidetes bacterium]|nr:hypothetical protein [Bacteroidota bacterium]